MQTHGHKILEGLINSDVWSSLYTSQPLHEYGKSDLEFWMKAVEQPIMIASYYSLCAEKTPNTTEEESREGV